MPAVSATPRVGKVKIVTRASGSLWHRGMDPSPACVLSIHLLSQFIQSFVQISIGSPLINGGISLVMGKYGVHQRKCLQFSHVLKDCNWRVKGITPTFVFS